MVLLPGTSPDPPAIVEMVYGSGIGAVGKATIVGAVTVMDMDDDVDAAYAPDP
jgi:hypothetical protein